MSDITLISGSTLGSAEYVAEHLAEKLEEAGHTTTIHHGPRLSDLPMSGIWLIVCSTHGAGDLPDNLQSFYDHLKNNPETLHHIRYGAIGIGSKEYDTFCGAIEKIDDLLTQNKAEKIGDVLKINILDHDIPEDPAEEWLRSWIYLL